MLEGRCKLSLDFSLSAIVSDAWYEGYQAMLELLAFGRCFRNSLRKVERVGKWK